MDFPVDKMINAAVDAREKAYAPYSNYRVGAAILTRQVVIIQAAILKTHPTA